MWIVNNKGQKEYSSGKSDWEGAKEEASKCLVFMLDVEEELISDETISCYNCRFRKWTYSSFVCCSDNKSSNNI
jgi:hypothetical protein